MSKPYKGSCLCGQVSFEVNAEPIVMSCCHCKNCKKYTGTAFTTNVVFPAGTLQVTTGEEMIKTYHDASQDSGNPIPRHFCSNCGSPLFNSNGDFGNTMAVFFGALDDFTLEHKRTGPEVEYYTKDREQWVSAFEGAGQARTKPGRSE